MYFIVCVCVCLCMLVLAKVSILPKIQLALESMTIWKGVREKYYSVSAITNQSKSKLNVSDGCSLSSSVIENS